MTNLTVAYKVHFQSARHGRKRMSEGAPPSPPIAPAAPAVPLGRIPRLSRLMALAIRFETLLAQGHVKDYADVARLGYVSRARVTQIMNLQQLAPDIQEAILFLPLIKKGRDSVKEWQVRPIAAEPNWTIQRRLWQKLLKVRTTCR